MVLRIDSRPAAADSTGQVAPGRVLVLAPGQGAAEISRAAGDQERRGGRAEGVLIVVLGDQPEAAAGVEDQSRGARVGAGIFSDNGRGFRSAGEGGEQAEIVGGEQRGRRPVAGRELEDRGGIGWVGWPGHGWRLLNHRAGRSSSSSRNPTAGGTGQTRVPPPLRGGGWYPTTGQRTTSSTRPPPAGRIAGPAGHEKIFFIWRLTGFRGDTIHMYSYLEKPP